MDSVESVLSELGIYIFFFRRRGKIVFISVKVSGYTRLRGSQRKCERGARKDFFSAFLGFYFCDFYSSDSPSDYFSLRCHTPESRESKFFFLFFY